MNAGSDDLDPILKRLTVIEDRLTRLESTILGTESGKQDEHEQPPEEVGTAKAAEILGVSKDTVLKLKEAGLLEYRNTAPPGSNRPVYAFTLRSVMELRTSYERDEPEVRRPVEPLRRRVKGRRRYKHLDTGD
jgi:hypothetical protein